MRPSRPGPGFLNSLMGVGLAIRSTPPPGTPGIVDDVVQDGQILDWAGGLQVIHTPGHTAGHIALLWPADGRVIICGDATTHMFGLGYAPGYGPGYGPIYEDLAEGQRSLCKLAALDFEAPASHMAARSVNLPARLSAANGRLKKARFDASQGLKLLLGFYLAN